MLIKAELSFRTEKKEWRIEFQNGAEETSFYKPTSHCAESEGNSDQRRKGDQLQRLSPIHVLV